MPFGIAKLNPSDNGEDTMKKSKKKRPAKGSGKGSTDKRAAEAAPAEPKKSKIHTIQGVRVLTPSGKKPGRRGAEGHLKLSQIQVIKGFNPRTALGDTTELERSIRKSGLINPLTVRPSGDGKKFHLVAGERRLQALKNLGVPWTDAIPVNIRVDLEGDDLASKAVAVAENSDDARTALSYIEVGRVCAEMEKKKWPISRIAGETGLHPKKVRRALDLVRAPDAIVAKVQSGDLVPMAALELTKLPKAQQEAVMEKVGPGATVSEVRRVRKEIEREERRTAVAQGEDKGKTKSGKARERAPTAWKSAREKQERLRQLCYDFTEADEKETDGWHELRGAIAAMLWDRGDIESPMLPSVHTDSESDPGAAKKANTLFEGLVKNEASLFKPEEEPDAAAKKAKGKKKDKKTKSQD